VTTRRGRRGGGRALARAARESPTITERAKRDYKRAWTRITAAAKGVANAEFTA